MEMPLCLTYNSKHWSGVIRQSLYTLTSRNTKWYELGGI